MCRVFSILTLRGLGMSAWVLLSTLGLAFTAAQAQTNIDWVSNLPGKRSVLDPMLVSRNPLALPRTIEEPVEEEIDEAEVLRELLRGQMETLPVLAYLWSGDMADRRVLIGSVVLRPDQKVPDGLFGEEFFSNYDELEIVVREIHPKRILFEAYMTAAEGDETEAIAIELKFDLRAQRLI